MSTKKSIFILVVCLLFLGCSNQQANPIKQIDDEKLTGSLNIPTENLNFKEYLPVLLFHYIKDVPPNNPNQNEYRFSFSPDKLQELLIYFKENNIETLTFWDLKNIIEGQKSFPAKAVILTFDDGHADHYYNAFALLKKHKQQGVFFIVTNKPGSNANYVTWEQIEEMSEQGQEIASHTMAHTDLTTLTNKQIERELEASKKIIEEKINKPVIGFSYPFGKYEDRILNIAKKHYLFARTTASGQYFSVSKRYEIPIVNISPTTSITSIKKLFSN